MGAGWIARSLVLGHGFGSPFQHAQWWPHGACSSPLPHIARRHLQSLRPLHSRQRPSLHCLSTRWSAPPPSGPSTVWPARPLESPVVTLRRGIAWPSRAPAGSAQRTLGGNGALGLQPCSGRSIHFSIYFSSAYLWDCTLTASLFAWTFYLALTLRGAPAKRWAMWGLLYGVTALCNPSILSLFPVLVLIGVIGRSMPVRVGLASRRCSDRHAPHSPCCRGRYATSASSTHPYPLRDGYWLEFWAGNSGDTSVSNPSWAHPASNPAELRKYLAMGEITYMAEKQELGHCAMCPEHPAGFLLVSGRRAIRFLDRLLELQQSLPIPASRSTCPTSRSAPCLTLLTLVGAWDLLRQHRRAALAFVAVIAVLSTALLPDPQQHGLPTAH